MFLNINILVHCQSIFLLCYFRSVGEASEELRSSLRGEELKAIGLQNELAACQAELSALQQTSRDLATRDVCHNMSLYCLVDFL